MDRRDPQTEKPTVPQKKASKETRSKRKGETVHIQSGEEQLNAVASIRPPEITLWHKNRKTEIVKKQKILEDPREGKIGQKKPAATRRSCYVERGMR